MAAHRNSFCPICHSETEFVRVVCMSMCDSKAATSLKSAPYMVTHKTCVSGAPGPICNHPHKQPFLEGPCEPCNSLVS